MAPRRAARGTDQGYPTDGRAETWIADIKRRKCPGPSHGPGNVSSDLEHRRGERTGYVEDEVAVTSQSMASDLGNVLCGGYVKTASSIKAKRYGLATVHHALHQPPFPGMASRPGTGPPQPISKRILEPLRRHCRKVELNTEAPSQSARIG